MKLSHNKFTSVLEWGENNHACELTIESPILLRSIIKDLTTDSEKKSLCITNNGEPLNFANDIDVIFNPLQLDFNNRRAVATLLKMILKTSLAEDFYLSTNQLKTKIIRYLSDIVDSENFTFEVETGEFSIDAIAKAANIHIVGDEDNFVELLVDYISMMTELVHTRLFVFVNLRSIISEDEFDDLLHAVQNHQIDILLLENIDHGHIKQVDRILIDADLCEI